MIRRSFTTGIKKLSEPRIKQCSKKGKLISLVPLLRNQNTVTIYIKGFLSRGESQFDFATWRSAHLSRINWESGCMAYKWQNKSFATHFDHVLPKSMRKHIPSFNRDNNSIIIPLPIFSLMHSSYHLFYRFYKVKKYMNPWMFALFGAQDIGLIASRIYFQYQKANQNARYHAPLFTEEIRKLKSNNPNLKIKVIAHSLGCKLALRAVDRYEELIDELHLLAPAITESEIIEIMQHHNNQFPVKKLRIYYSNDDLILHLFHLIQDSPAIGSYGLSPSILETHSNMKQCDVSEHLEGFNKHKSYSWVFPKFVR